MDDLVVLSLEGKNYNVKSFEGIEKLNAPLCFIVTFITDQNLNHALIGQKATLGLPSSNQEKRQWHGQIEQIEHFKFIHTNKESQQITLTLSHPLKKLSKQSSQQQFYNKNELEVACHYLEKNNLSYTLLGINKSLFEKQALLHQLPTQSDLNFFHQLLSRSGLMYFIGSENKIYLFSHLSFLANSSIDTLYSELKFKRSPGMHGR